MSRQRSTPNSSPVPDVRWCPVRPTAGIDKPWEGIIEKKPWEYDVTIAIPHLDTPEPLEEILKLYELQTEQSYITIIDTGSTEANLAKLEEIIEGRTNIELHKLRLLAVEHPSDLPAMAMDLAMTLCRTKYMFCTHTDVFPMRQDLIEYFALLADAHKIAGYQITPRSGMNWKGMVSHTATMIKMSWADKVGLGWSQRRLRNISTLTHAGMASANLDTEICINYIMRMIGFDPKIIGTEENDERTLDENIDHIKSYGSLEQLPTEKIRVVSNWMADARVAARNRIERWQNQY